MGRKKIQIPNAIMIKIITLILNTLSLDEGTYSYSISQSDTFPILTISIISVFPFHSDHLYHFSIILQ